MAEGQKAAEQTRSLFGKIGEAGEDIRKNVNSYADNIVGGNKTHSSSGIHPDVKKTGDELERGARDAGQKIDNFIDKHKSR